MSITIERGVIIVGVESAKSAAKSMKEFAAAISKAGITVKEAGENAGKSMEQLKESLRLLNKPKLKQAGSIYHK